MAAKVKEVKNKEVETQIYIGPSLKKYGLSSGMVTIGNIEEIFSKVIKEIPEIKELFVKINELGEKKKAISQKGSLENIYYEKVKEKGGF